MTWVFELIITTLSLALVNLALLYTWERRKTKNDREALTESYHRMMALVKVDQELDGTLSLEDLQRAWDATKPVEPGDGKAEVLGEPTAQEFEEYELSQRPEGKMLKAVKRMFGFKND